MTAKTAASELAKPIESGRWYQLEVHWYDVEHDADGREVRIGEPKTKRHHLDSMDEARRVAAALRAQHGMDVTRWHPGAKEAGSTWVRHYTVFEVIEAVSYQLW